MRGNKMADVDDDINKSNILYELLILSEWIEDHNNVITKNSLNPVQSSVPYFSPWKLFKKTAVDNFRFLETAYPWHLAVSSDGKVIAVLQETILEIKTAKDEFSTVVGKACIPSDSYPKLRKLTWSPDNSFIAVARDNGVVHVFNFFGCNVATIEAGENSIGNVQPVVGLCFLQPKFKSTKWSNELLIVYHKGDVRSILLSSLDGQDSDENIKFSLSGHYPKGIFSIAYDSNNLLIVAGATSANENGISVWRILNDYPFLKYALDIDDYSCGSRSLLRFFPGFSKHNNSQIIFKMSLSPDLKLLACLHISGEISIWTVPTIKLYKKWALSEQPNFEKNHPEKDEIRKNEQFYHPIDIAWWSTEAIVIARKNGAITVCSINTLHNLLGDSPEFLSESPQIACIRGPKQGVIALECETTSNCKRNHLDENKDIHTSILHESIQAALYSFTDIERFEPKRKTPKIIQKTYRMLVLKRTTPKELYTRKIENEEYEEALILAKNYHLDCDLVYQRRWRNSNASKTDIHKYLEKVKKISWVVSECLERVPNELEDAKELLKFGLQKTNINVSIKKLNTESKHLVLCRAQLLRFFDSLSIYEKIIESPSKYNSSEYEKFRKQDAVVATVNFARQENWQAVSIMFTYIGKRVLPHWLPILANFPETLRPLQYRSLLPEVADKKVISWDTKKLRDFDWVEEPVWQSLIGTESNEELDILYKNNAQLMEYKSDHITIDIVEDWYKKRTYEIEQNTGLVENALSFVILAKERGIKSLDKLQCDLLTLESLVYLVGEDSITLNKLETLNPFEQAKLLMSKTSKVSFITDIKNLIVPFVKRCKTQNSCSSDSLLRNLLLHFSEESLELPLELLYYLKEGFTNPLNLTLTETINIVLDCMYSCPKADQLETCFNILECLPQRSDSLSREDSLMHDKIDKVEVHLEVCEFLERYETPKSVRFIQENENNEEIGKELMNKMAEFTRRESLDFTELLADLEVLQTKIFPCIPEKYCKELSIFTQMTCECEEIILSAEEVLQCRKNEKSKMIPFDRSIELILRAAQVHFEKATNPDDHYIKLAQICLSLIGEPHPQICKELDLIEAIQLLGDFEVNMLPIQVRKTDQRMNLIESCIKANSKNYKSCQKLLQLAQALRIYGENRVKREGEVLVLIAEYALNVSDYQYCSEICSRLMTRNFSPAWMVVNKLAQNMEYSNISNKMTLLAFSILHSPIENAEKLIECRIRLHDKCFGTAQSI